ncbi:hypothetical protein [Brevundimonas sp. DC300-4]|uniref:hypothetical protein n=1 Tax=Brevundimonas sp. DC300-4 TaxID=2804594 RepID=UPI003CEA9640
MAPSDISAETPFLEYRQALRLLNEFQFFAGNVLIPTVGLRFDRSVPALMLLRADRLRNQPRGVSISSIAASFRHPRETIRRAMLDLQAVGLAERAEDGWSLSGSSVSARLREEMSQEILRHFGHFIDGLAPTGVLPRHDARKASPDARLIAALDIYLTIFDFNMLSLSECRELYLLVGVSIMEMSRVTHCRELANRYSSPDTLPPHSLTMPVTLKQVSSWHGFPASSVWRSARRLEQRGALKRDGAGYRIGDVFAATPESRRWAVPMLQYIRRRLADCAG